VLLGVVDARPGGAVDDDVVPLDDPRHGPRVVQVGVGPDQRRHVLAAAAEQVDEVGAEHPGGSGDEPAHGSPFGVEDV
jgi:hypothetical protein